MQQTTYQTALKAIERSRQPLIVIPEGGGADSFASALGIGNLLRKLEKPVHIVSADREPMTHLEFLDNEHSPKVTTELENIRTFLIQVDVSKTKVDELSYDVVGDKLQIYLKPKSGVWKPEDVDLSSSTYKHDLIICTGAPNLESCAEISTGHAIIARKSIIPCVIHLPAGVCLLIAVPIMSQIYKS